jgi:hypothetical protein
MMRGVWVASARALPPGAFEGQAIYAIAQAKVIWESTYQWTSAVKVMDEATSRAALATLA